VNLGAPERSAVPAPHVTPVVYMHEKLYSMAYPESLIKRNNKKQNGVPYIHKYMYIICISEDIP
jgi:hypothetical protein